MCCRRAGILVLAASAPLQVALAHRPRDAKVRAGKARLATSSEAFGQTTAAAAGSAHGQESLAELLGAGRSEAAASDCPLVHEEQTSDLKLRYWIEGDAVREVSMSRAYYLSTSRSCDRAALVADAFVAPQLDDADLSKAKAYISFSSPPPAGSSYVCINGRPRCFARVERSLGFRPSSLVPAWLGDRLPASLRASLGLSLDLGRSPMLEFFQWMVLAAALALAALCGATLWLLLGWASRPEPPALSALRLPTVQDRITGLALQMLTFSTGVITLTEFSLLTLFTHVQPFWIDTIICLAWLVGILGNIAIADLFGLTVVADSALAVGHCIDGLSGFSVVYVMAIAGFVGLCGVIGVGVWSTPVSPVVFTGALSGFLGAAKTLHSIYEARRNAAEHICRISFSELASSARGEAPAEEGTTSLVPRLSRPEPVGLSLDEFCARQPGDGSESKDAGEEGVAVSGRDPFWHARVVHRSLGTRLATAAVPLSLGMLLYFLVSFWQLLFHFTTLRPDLGSFDGSSGIMVPAFQRSTTEYTYLTDEGVNKLSIFTQADEAVVQKRTFALAEARATVYKQAALTPFVLDKNKRVQALTANVQGGNGHRQTWYNASVHRVMHTPFTLMLRAGNWSRCILWSGANHITAAVPAGTRALSVEVRMKSHTAKAPYEPEALELAKEGAAVGSVRTFIRRGVAGRDCKCALMEGCISCQSMASATTPGQEDCLLSVLMHVEGRTCEELHAVPDGPEPGSPLDRFNQRRAVAAKLVFDGELEGNGTQSFEDLFAFPEVPVAWGPDGTKAGQLILMAMDTESLQRSNLVKYSLELVRGALAPDTVDVQVEAGDDHGITYRHFRAGSEVLGLTLDPYDVDRIEGRYFNVSVRLIFEDTSLRLSVAKKKGVWSRPGPGGEAGEVAVIQVDKFQPQGQRAIGMIVPRGGDASLTPSPFKVLISTAEQQGPTYWAVAKNCSASFRGLPVGIIPTLLDQATMTRALRYCDSLTLTLNSAVADGAVVPVRLAAVDVLALALQLHRDAQVEVLEAASRGAQFSAAAGAGRKGVMNAWKALGIFVQGDALVASNAHLCKDCFKALGLSTFTDHPEAITSWIQILTRSEFPSPTFQLVCEMVTDPSVRYAILATKTFEEVKGLADAGCYEPQLMPRFAEAAVERHDAHFLNALAKEGGSLSGVDLWSSAVNFACDACLGPVRALVEATRQGGSSYQDEGCNLKLSPCRNGVALADSLRVLQHWHGNISGSCSKVVIRLEDWGLDETWSKRLAHGLEKVQEKQKALGLPVEAIAQKLATTQRSIEERQGIEIMTALAKIPCAQHLDFSEMEVRKISSWIGILAKSPYLLSIKLDTTDVGDAEIIALARSRSLEELSLPSTDVGDAGVTALAACRSLKSLVLSGCSISEVSVKALAKLPSLRKLDLSSTFVDDEGVYALAASRTLESLSLQATRVGDAGVRSLAAAAGLRALDLRCRQLTSEVVLELVSKLKLRSLFLGVNQMHCLGDGFVNGDYFTITKEVAEALVRHQSNSLKTLSLAAVKAVDGDAGFSTLAHIEGLETLNLRFTKASDLTARALAKSTSLRRLNFAEADISIEGVKALAASPHLESLGLAIYTGMHDAEVRGLGDDAAEALASSASLRILDMTTTLIGVAGVRALSRSNISTLILENNALKDDSLEALANSTALQLLDVRSCGALTDRGFAALLRSRSLRALRVSSHLISEEMKDKIKRSGVVIPTSGDFFYDLEDII